MTAPGLYLFDDQVARRWEPFALTRPVGELLFGVLTLRARAERVLGSRCAGHLTADHLVGFEEFEAPPVLASLPSAEVDRLFLSSRFLPAWGWAGGSLAAGPLRAPTGEVVGWYAPAGAEPPPGELFLEPAKLEAADGGSTIEGILLENVWDLIPRNPDQVARDVEALAGEVSRRELPAGAHHWGKHPLILDPRATIEPGAAFDTAEGPIWIDAGARVRAFTRLAGPAYIGRESVVLGGPVDAVSIGPMCRVRGELAESVCVGYVNKQHDGHIGHAYLGRWVNLGAETTNSDLKNNYGSIRIWTPLGEIDTGEIKMGSLIGDHVKTGIGLLLNTGTVVGAGSNLYGAEMPPKYVPPFSWGTGDQLVEYRLDRFLEVARMAMARRGVELTDGMREQLGRSWARGRQQAEAGSAASGQ